MLYVVACILGSTLGGKRACLSAPLENKVLSINERGLTTTRWTEYNAGTKRVQKETVPSSTITAEAVSVDGFVLSQSDHAGISTTRVSCTYDHMGRRHHHAAPALPLPGLPANRHLPIYLK